jgi:hypothetical protein
MERISHKNNQKANDYFWLLQSLWKTFTRNLREFFLNSNDTYAGYNFWVLLLDKSYLQSEQNKGAKHHHSLNAKKVCSKRLDSNWYIHSKVLSYAPAELQPKAKLQRDCFIMFLPCVAIESEWSLLYKRKEKDLFPSQSWCLRQRIA